MRPEARMVTRSGSIARKEDGMKSGLLVTRTCSRGTIRVGKVDIVLCSKLNRLGRSFSELDGALIRRSKLAAGCINYILAVDEMEKYLTQQYGPGELVSQDESNKRRNCLQVQSYLKGRAGLLVMRDSTPGVHTEFWDGSSFLQKDMAVKHLLELSRVLFGTVRWRRRSGLKISWAHSHNSRQLAQSISYQRDLRSAR